MTLHVGGRGADYLGDLFSGEASWSVCHAGNVSGQTRTAQPLEKSPPPRCPRSKPAQRSVQDIDPVDHKMPGIADGKHWKGDENHRHVEDPEPDGH